MAVQSQTSVLAEALRLLNAGEFGRALTLIERVRVSAPWSWGALLVNAIIRLRMKHPDLAMSSLLQAFALSPGNEDVLYRLGECSLSMKEYAIAEAWFLRAALIRPDWADPYFMIGSTYYFLGKHAAAVKWLAKAVRSRPNWAAAHFAVGRALFLTGQRAAASPWLAQAAALDPGFRKHEEFLLATLTPDDFEVWFAEPL